MRYDYEHFSPALLLQDMRFRSGPAPGDDFPDFDLVRTDGARVTKGDLSGRFVLLTEGSVT